MAKGNVRTITDPEPMPSGIAPLQEILAGTPEGLGLDVQHPEVDRLRRELADKQKELESTQQQLAAATAPLQKLPDSGPGKYKVILRHSPSRLKEAVVEARNEDEAWNKFLQAAMAKTNNTKDPERRELKAFENHLRLGRLNGFARTVRKLEETPA
jgi:hypothetical protein